jgi:Co/Zn/Cd efflux system component
VARIHLITLTNDASLHAAKYEARLHNNIHNPTTYRRNRGAFGEGFKMAWSKSTRITIMLAIDAAFFVLELGVGLLVGSLALMADAFHMVRKTSQFARLEYRLTVV